MTKTYRRKQLLVNRGFQLNFLNHSVFLAVLLLAIIYAANQFFFWRFGQLGLQQGLPADHIFFQFLEDQKFLMGLIFLAVGAVVVTVLIFFGLYYSNRIAGPLLRLQRFFENKDLPSSVDRLEFRENDFFPEVATAINDYFSRTESSQDHH
jgi:hypothetical protein